MMVEMDDGDKQTEINEQQEREDTTQIWKS